MYPRVLILKKDSAFSTSKFTYLCFYFLQKWKVARVRQVPVRATGLFLSRPRLRSEEQETRFQQDRLSQRRRREMNLKLRWHSALRGIFDIGAGNPKRPIDHKLLCPDYPHCDPQEPALPNVLHDPLEKCILNFNAKF